MPAKGTKATSRLPTADRCCPQAPDAGPSRRRAAAPRPDAGSGGRWRGSGALVIEIAARPAPRYWRRHRRRAGRPPAAARSPARPRPGRRTQRSGARQGLEQVTTVHRDAPLRRMNSGEDRNSVFQSCGEIAWSSAARRRAQRLAQAVEVERVLELREGGQVGRRPVGLEQAGGARADLARDLEAHRHLPGPAPGRRSSIAVGRLVVVQAFAEPVQPALDRRGVEDHPVVIGEPHRRQRVVDRILESLPSEALNSRRMEHRAPAPRRCRRRVAGRSAPCARPAPAAGCRR